MQCPRCRSVGLHTGEADALTVRACGHCGGVWLDPDDANKLLGYVTVKEWTEPVQVSCAQCGAVMQGRYVPEAGVVVDVCGSHGFWFDYNELEKLAWVVAGKRGRPAPSLPVPAVAGAALAGAVAASAVTAVAMAGDDVVPDAEDEPSYAGDVAVEAAIFAPDVIDAAPHVGDAAVDLASDGTEAAGAAAGAVAEGGAAAGDVVAEGGSAAAEAGGAALEAAGDIASGAAEAGGGFVEAIGELLSGLVS